MLEIFRVQSTGGRKEATDILLASRWQYSLIILKNGSLYKVFVRFLLLNLKPKFQELKGEEFFFYIYLEADEQNNSIKRQESGFNNNKVVFL